MAEQDQRSKAIAAITIWGVLALFAGIFGIAVLGFVYTSHADCSITPEEGYESANTIFGWALAVVGTAVPVAVAFWFRPPRWASVAIVLGAAIDFLLWIWWLNPGGCDWQQALVIL